jgi:hypothetical protein
MSNDNKVPSLLDSPKLRLSSWNAQTKTRPTLKVSLWNNNPRIEISLNDKSVQGRDGFITKPLDPLLFEALMEKLYDIATGPADTKFKTMSLEPDKNAQQGQRVDPLPVADLWVGKDKDGAVFMSVIDKKAEKPILQFFFGPNDGRYFKGLHGDGTEWTKAEMSVFIARGWARLMARTVSTVIDRLYKPVEFQGNRGGGGGGGYQNNRGGQGGGGGGYQQRNSGGGGGGGQRSAPAEAEIDESSEIPF